MLNRKLLEVLSRLEEPDLKRLRLFIASPFFNQHLRKPTAVLHLYDYIMFHQADESSPHLAKEVVFRKFFPERPYQEKIKNPLDTLASDLFGLVKHFLSYAFQEDTSKEQAELFAQMRFYRRHGLEDRFQQTVGALHKKQKSSPFRDAYYFMSQFRIEEEVSNFRGILNTFEDDANLYAVHHNIDRFYEIVKLEHICALLYQRKFSNIEVTQNSILSQAVLQSVEQADLPAIPLLAVYLTVYKLLLPSAEDKHFHELKTLLEKYEHEIPIDKYRDLMAYYRYFWAKRYYKSGNYSLLLQLFSIYKEHYEKGYFYIDGLITVYTLRSLLVISLLVNQFEWAKILLDMHPPERICGTRFPAEAHNLNYAEYFFHLKNYNEASNRLIYCNFENPNFSILADILVIKIYFETSNELLTSRIKALEQKVRRTKISAENKQRYYNFLNSLNKIVSYGWKKGSAKREKLIEEIKSTPNVAHREWLLEKLGVEVNG